MLLVMSLSQKHGAVNGLLSDRCVATGHVAMCMKELATCIESVNKSIKTGNIAQNLQKVLEGTSLDEAMRTWKITRQLLTMLESRIKELCDPKRFPQGSTHPCTHAMDVLKELNITEDTCDMIMCAVIVL